MTENGSNNSDAQKPDDHAGADEGTTSPDSLPSGAGPQADGEQSDIASGGGSAE